MERPAVLMGLCMLLPIPGAAVRLYLQDQLLIPGQTLIAPVSFFSEGAAVSGIQFDLQADPILSIRALPGTDIGAAAKTMHTAVLPDGTLRVIVVGFNRQSVADGDLLRIALTVDPNATPGSTQIRMGNTLASDPDGTALSVAAPSANLSIQSGPPVMSLPASGVVNAATLLPGAVSPGEIVTIFGGSGLAATSDLKMNGLRAPILYTGAGQINAVVPFGLDPSGGASLELRSQGQSVGAIPIATAAAAPGIFTLNSSGTGPGAILNEDSTVNSFVNPAAVGSVIMIYGTGFGLFSPLPADGEPVTQSAPVVLPVKATIGGIDAEVTYAGSAPGLIAGMVQVNLRIPPNAGSNPAAPVSLTIGSIATPPGVTVAVQQ